MLTKRIKTALSILRTQGVQQVARISLETFAMWWRHGDPLEFGKYLGRPTDIARLDGCRFVLDAPMVSEDLKYLLLSAKHEAAERTLIRRFVDPLLPIVELGGALGVVSCIANKLLVDPARHVVVEANPALMPVLVTNRDRNHCRFTVVNRAVAYDEPTIRFHVAADVLAGGIRVPTDRSVAVAATTLREILDERDFGRCTLICDIEGSEVELVRREGSTLANRVDVIIMEVHERLVGHQESDGMLGTLQQMGFEVVDRLQDTVALRKRDSGTGRTRRAPSGSAG
jgi:FkbM family methyltransferase